MHVIKPQALCLGTRPIEFRKRFGLAVSGSLYLPFDQGPRGSLWSEQSMWDFLAQEMAMPLIDEGVPKVAAEFLVHGRAFSQPQRSNAVAVRARVGSRDKTLYVFGDRQWVGRTPTDPAPFESIPIAWERAYGGAGYAENPLGLGHAPVGDRHPLPNLELPEHRVQRPGLAAVPAGYGSLDVMHPQRQALRGTYDESWLKEHAPGFPPDIDWHYFNLAPRDQWFDAALTGREPFEFEHMHPRKAKVQGQLPGLRVRAFCSYGGTSGDAKGLRLKEVPMRLTTLWFFPHAECLVMTFHGLAETSQDDASDIVRLLGAVERLDEPKDPAHYLKTMSQRLDARMAAFHALNDAPLLPDGVDLHDPRVDARQAALRPEGLKEDAQRRRAEVDMSLARDQARRMGKDPDALGLRLAPRVAPPTTAELPAYIEQAQAEAERQQWAVVEDAVGHAERALELLKKGKVDPAQLVHRGPPAYRASTELAAVVQGFERAGKPLDASRRQQFDTMFRKQEVLHHMTYLQNAHHQPPVRRLVGEAAARCRAEVQWLLDRRVRSWPGIDLTGADLSGLDLSGLDLTGAWLEHADLTGARLKSTVFRGAVLAHAVFTGADASEASFVGANLGKAQLAGAVFDDADFSGAILSGCHLKGTRFIRARLSRTDLLDTQWGEADWRGLRADNLLFHERELKGLDLGKARLVQCTFVGCDLSQVDFGSARLNACTFTQCQLDKARFSACLMPGTVFADNTRLTQADFSGADLSNANLGECDATGALFVQARLDGANLGKARLDGCNFDRASAVRALLRKAQLRRAVLTGANLMDAILQGANLCSANLRGANLYGADLARVLMDPHTTLAQANVDRARTWPRLPLATEAGA